MKTKFSLILFTFFLSFCINAQTTKLTGKVIDSISGEPLPYVNIMLQNCEIGVTADINGNFELIITDTLITDTIVFSHVGYQTIKENFNNLSNVISLARQAYLLSGVTIINHSKKPKAKLVNRFKPNECSIRYSNLNNMKKWIPNRSKEPTIEAISFEYKEEYGTNDKIKEVWVYLTSFKDSCTFRLRLLKSSTNVIPSTDLIYDPILVKVTNEKQLYKINIEKYNIRLSEHTIFVGVELLIRPENSSIIINEGKSVTIYSPFLNYFPTKEQKYHYWIYSQGKWSKITQKVPQYTKSVREMFYKPAISLLLIS